MLVPLKEGIIYGPLESRRFGKSLGVNLMPKQYKLCTFNCVYCHFGWTDKHTADTASCIEDFHTLDDVVGAVEQAFSSSLDFDSITFSGNGEPTLYPWFPGLVDTIANMKQRYRPHVKLTLLSNATRLTDPAIRESIAAIDLPFFKLDAGTGETFKAINNPAPGIVFETILDMLESMGNVRIQTLLLQGKLSNCGDEELSLYFQHIRRIKPLEVHIYSIDRPVPDKRIALVSREMLDEIAERGQRETGSIIKAFSYKR